MSRWRKQVRFVMIAVAGFVLLVTVLPQVASGIGLGSLASRLDSTAKCSGSSGSSGSSSSCCSGSSGSSLGTGSSSCGTGPGTISGTVTVTGAPAGFSPAVIGAGACPFVARHQPLCAAPQFALASYGSYNLSLDPGTWVVYGFYENTIFAGAFLGAPHVVTMESGASKVFDATIPYAKPATVHVSIAVHGLPAYSPVLSAYAVLCPVGVPYNGVSVPLPCVQGGTSSYPPSPTPSDFSITGLPAGQWTAYPGYCTEFGCAANPFVGQPVATVAGQTSRVHLATGFVVPPEGQLNATVSVVGAPAGFNDPVGIMACQTGQYGYCDASSGVGGGLNSLILADGVWTVSAFYTVSPFGNAVSGPSQTLIIRGGQIKTRSFTVAYQVLGTAQGTIDVTGRPTSVKVTSYSIYACPLGLTNFLSCVTEYSGAASYSYGAADPKSFGKTAHRGTLPKAAGTKIDVYNLPTLTPGPWSIEVSYSTAFGYFSAQQPTIVNVAAGQITTTRIKIPYQQPYSGIVKGTLTVVGIGGGFQPLVRACNSVPVAGACSGELDTYLGTNGTYQLQLPPGIWWVQGEVYVYSGFTTETLLSPAQEIGVVAGTQTKANFTVTGP